MNRNDGLFALLALGLLALGGAIGNWGLVFIIIGVSIMVYLAGRLPRYRTLAFTAIAIFVIYQGWHSTVYLLFGGDPMLADAWRARSRDTTMVVSEVVQPEAVDARELLKVNCERIEREKTAAISIEMGKAKSAGEIRNIQRRIERIARDREECQNYITAGDKDGLIPDSLPKGITLPSVSLGSATTGGPGLPAGLVIAFALLLVLLLIVGVSFRGWAARGILAALFLGAVWVVLTGAFGMSFMGLGAMRREHPEQDYNATEYYHMLANLSSGGTLVYEYNSPAEAERGPMRTAALNCAIRTSSPYGVTKVKVTGAGDPVEYQLSDGDKVPDGQAVFVRTSVGEQVILQCQKKLGYS